MARPQQDDLFGAPPPARNTGVVRIDGGGAQLTPLQREFNRLSALIDKLRVDLRDWEQLDAQIETRLAAAEPEIEAATDQARRELLATLESLLGHPQKPPLSKRGRRMLTQTLLDVVTVLIEAHPDEAGLIATHDLYSDQTWEQLRAEVEQMQKVHLEFAEAMAAEAFGEDAVKDHGAASADELFETVQARVAQHHEREQAQWQQSRKERERAQRAEEAEQAKAVRQQDIRQSVRAVYRQLASALHPDREVDPQQRERKTVLMQRINQAYAANDLLALLALQMEVEQLDDDALAALPDQRLMHFVDVLKEQVRTVRGEIQTHIDELRQRSGAPRLRSRKDFERDLERHLEERRQQHRALEAQSNALREPRLRQTIIDQYEANARAQAFYDRQRQAQAEEEMEMLIAFAQAQQRVAGAGRKRGRKRR